MILVKQEIANLPYGYNTLPNYYLLDRTNNLKSVGSNSVQQALNNFVFKGLFKDDPERITIAKKLGSIVIKTIAEIPVDITNPDEVLLYFNTTYPELFV